MKNIFRTQKSAYFYFQPLYSSSSSGTDVCQSNSCCFLNVRFMELFPTGFISLQMSIFNSSRSGFSLLVFLKTYSYPVYNSILQVRRDCKQYMSSWISVCKIKKERKNTFLSILYDCDKLLVTKTIFFLKKNRHFSVFQIYIQNIFVSSFQWLLIIISKSLWNDMFNSNSRNQTWSKNFYLLCFCFIF